MKTAFYLSIFLVIILLIASCKKENWADSYIIYNGDKYASDSCYIFSGALVAPSNLHDKGKYAMVVVNLPSLPATPRDYPISHGSDFAYIGMVATAVDSPPKLYRSLGTDNATLKVTFNNGKMSATCSHVRMATYPMPPDYVTPAPDTIDLVVHLNQTK